MVSAWTFFFFGHERYITLAPTRHRTHARSVVPGQSRGAAHRRIPSDLPPPYNCEPHGPRGCAVGVDVRGRVREGVGVHASRLVRIGRKRAMRASHAH